MRFEKKQKNIRVGIQVTKNSKIQNKKKKKNRKREVGIKETRNSK